MYPLSLIFFTYIIGEISGATLPGTQKEGSLKEQSFSTISDQKICIMIVVKGNSKKFHFFISILINLFVMISFYPSAGLLKIQIMRKF